MARVLYDTHSALLDFDRGEVMERVSSFTERHGVETAADLGVLVSSSSDDDLPPKNWSRFCDSFLR